MKNTEQNFVKKTLTDKERAFANAYVLCLNKKEAAIASGYSTKNPGQSGFEVYQRPHVKAYIETLLEGETLAAKEVIKMTSDISKANLSDYFKPTSVCRVQKVKKGLQELIDQLQYNIELEKEFLVLGELNKKEKKEVENYIRSMEREIVRYEIELNRNPGAFRVVDGEPELVEEQQLDVNALIADKDKARVKMIKHTQFGLHVELYPADAAQDRLLRINGAFEKDNQQQQPIIAPSVNVYAAAPPLSSNEKEVSV